MKGFLVLILFCNLAFAIANNEDENDSLNSESIKSDKSSDEDWSSDDWASNESVIFKKHKNFFFFHFIHFFLNI